MTIGLAHVPSYTWPRDNMKPWKDREGRECVAYAPFWISVDNKPKDYPESAKILRAFKSRWKLRRVPDEQLKYHRNADNRIRELLFSLVFSSRQYAIAGLTYGTYLSHRKGRGPQRAVVEFLDPARCTRLRYQMIGVPAEQACRIMRTDEFKQDLQRMVQGEPVSYPPIARFWHDGVKTQYASNPKYGGVKNFIRAHLMVTAVLDLCVTLGMEVEVRDDGKYWENRSVEMLVDEVASWNEFIAGMSGALSDTAKVVFGEDALEAPIMEYPDFEHLEANGVDDRMKKTAAILMGVQKQLMDAKDKRAESGRQAI